jgi:hypothetical protein
MAKNTKFDCIEKWVKANPEYKIYEFPNDKDSRSYVVVWQTDIKKYWGFFEDGAHAYYNVSSLGKKPMKIGKWQCDGTDNFMFTSGIDVGGYPASPKAYYSKDGFVEKEIPQPETTTEPEQTTEPKADDSFPLKLRSEGPNVVKLQKFLNDKIPGNPLTVNGVFDQKTADKLIEFQKKEGIIK